MRRPSRLLGNHGLRLSRWLMLTLLVTCGCDRSNVSEHASHQLRPPVLADAGPGRMADASPRLAEMLSATAGADAAALRGLEAACAAACKPSAALPCADPSCADTCATSLSGVCQTAAIEFLQCLARRPKSEFTCDGDGRRVSPIACKLLETKLVDCLRAK